MSKSTPTALRVTHSANVVTVSAGAVGNPGNRKLRNESAFWYALLPRRILKDFVYHYRPTGQRSNRD